MPSIQSERGTYAEGSLRGLRAISAYKSLVSVDAFRSTFHQLYTLLTAVLPSDRFRRLTFPLRNKYQLYHRSALRLSQNEDIFGILDLPAGGNIQLKSKIRMQIQAGV